MGDQKYVQQNLYSPNCKLERYVENNKGVYFLLSCIIYNKKIVEDVAFSIGVSNIHS
jgi:hypothetical protein